MSSREGQKKLWHRECQLSLTTPRASALGTFQKAEVWPTLRSGTGPRHPEGPLGTLHLLALGAPECQGTNEVGGTAPSYCGPGPCPAPAQPIEIWAVQMRGVDKTRRLIKTAGKAVNLGVSAWVQGLQCLGALRALSKILAEF